MDGAFFNLRISFYQRTRSSNTSNLNWSQRSSHILEKIHLDRDSRLLKAMGGGIGPEGPDLEAQGPFALS